MFGITGNARRPIRIYINCNDVRFLEKHNTPIKDGDIVLILPAVVGG
jgi:molybdopterin synthase sulfur carrier subunit